jgi:3-oxoacyl-[acyl-carrier-protein] synthase II
MVPALGRGLPRVVISGVGLTSPNGNSLPEYRRHLLSGVSGVRPYTIRYFGPTLAGVCDFDVLRHQSKKEARRGTRAGAIAVWCANEALQDAGIDLAQRDRARIGVYIGTTEHGNVETENEVHNVSQYGYDLRYWSHHHNPRTVANNPAGEVTLNLALTGPAYCLGGACAAGNLGLIHAVQMLQLGQVDLALGGGVSESIHTFGIFASFQAQGALASHADPTKASRPFDKARNGIVVAEGGCLYVLERLDDALARGAKIYAEVQNRCMRGALAHAGLAADQIDILNTHATSTPSGDTVEARAVGQVFGDSRRVHINNTKSFIGHAMGAAGALELAGNLPSFADRVVHPTINVEQLDPDCDLYGLVLNEPKTAPQVEYVMNMSFGMLGINSAVIVGRPPS